MRVSAATGLGGRLAGAATILGMGFPRNRMRIVERDDARRRGLFSVTVELRRRKRKAPDVAQPGHANRRRTMADTDRLKQWAHVPLLLWIKARPVG